ncbi:MAG: DUF4388 domain-containing protein [Planctomycetota bacterium]|nr:DUF4388 domain-containing protein [Planctomycetota bacterium]
MGFAGNLQTLALPEVLQTLHRIQATGVLRLAARDGGRDLIFSQGELIGVAFRRGEEKQAVLRRLILDRRLDAAAAAQISQTGRESQVLARLIEGGLIDEATVREAIQRQAEEELQSLFTWDYAEFVFHDAGAGDPEIDALVEHARADGLVFNIPSILMESARRQDEWERIRQALPDGGLVLGASAGRESELAAEAASYPGSAVVPLIDAVRSVDDIVRDSVASRFDVLACLAGLLQRGLVVSLSRDDIIYHADYLAGQGDHRRASILYRRALAVRPQDSDTARKLAETLAKLGDAPEAAASYAQLAQGALDHGDSATAVAHARKAVQLAPREPAWQRTLARCLLAVGGEEARSEALGAWLQAAELWQAQGHLEDARRACLEVLELDGANEPARRQLARLRAATQREAVPAEAVDCVRCGHRNRRDDAHCTRCRTPLALTCLACGRQVGVSDAVCLYCGADPHRPPASTAQRGPATTRLANPEKVRPGAIAGGAQAVRDQLAAMVAAARAKEAAEDWEGALAAWRELAKIQVDNADLHAHIRRLEGLAHDAFVERTIEEGHQLRRVRRYWSAIRRYRAALRSMASDDPRVPRLQEILAATTRVAQRIALVYAAALLVIVIGAGIALRPWLVQRRFAAELAQLAERLAAAAEDGAALAALRPELEQLGARIEQLGESPRWRALRTRALELAGEHAVAWQRAASRALAQVETAIDHGDLKRARDLLSAYHALYHDRSPRAQQAAARLEEAQRRRDELNARIQEAPRFLAAAEAEERGGRLGAALAAYRTLVESPNVEVAQQAAAAVARLAPQADAVAKRVEDALLQAEALRASDLQRADAVLAAVADEAAVWGLGARVHNARTAIAATLAEARSEALRLTADASAERLREFLHRFPGAPEAVAVRQRLDALLRAEEARQQALARYRQFLEREQWEQAWQAGRDLLAGYGAQVGDLELPLCLESRPPAEVSLDGRVLGTTPLVLRYRPGQRGELLLRAPGFQPQRLRLEQASAEWRTVVALTRQTLWQTVLGRVPIELVPYGERGCLIVAQDGVFCLDERGQVRWQTALGGDELAARERSDSVAVLPEGGAVIALPGGGVAVLDATGAVRQRLATQRAVRGRPAVYSNDVLGAHTRFAFAAESLSSGVPGRELRTLPLPAPAIAGPLPWPAGLDRWLIVGDSRGRLLAFEESSRRLAWELDLQAVDIGRLVPVPDGLVTIQDGTRLVAIALASSGATLRWSLLLPAPAVGAPALHRDQLLVAAGSQLLRYGLDGTPRTAWPLPAPAATAVAAEGGVIALADAEGRLHVFTDEGPRWSTALPARAVALAVVGHILVADAAGTVSAFAP